MRARKKNREHIETEHSRSGRMAGDGGAKQIERAMGVSTCITLETELCAMNERLA